MYRLATLSLLLLLLLAPPAVVAAPSAKARSSALRLDRPGLKDNPLLLQLEGARLKAMPLFFQQAPDIRVDLDLDTVRVRDALKQLFDQAKEEYAIEADVPEDTRITIRVRQVQFRTALDLITQAAGVNWRSTTEGGKRIFRVGKSAAVPKGGLGRVIVPEMLDLPKNRSGLIFSDGLAYTLFQEQMTMTCPHCKGTSTGVAPKQQPKCPKCERTFDRAWKFCPVDGAKRPPAPGEWRYCPLCGKDVEPADATAKQ